MIQRIADPILLKLFDQYPVVTITGPRQSGKTVLCRSTFPDLKYVNLEDRSIREQAIEDPRGFLKTYPAPAVIDEIQRAPDLQGASILK